MTEKPLQGDNLRSQSKKDEIEGNNTQGIREEQSRIARIENIYELKTLIMNQRTEIRELNHKLDIQSIELERFRFITNLSAYYEFSILIDNKNNFELEWISKDFKEETGYSFETLLDSQKSSSVLQHHDYELLQEALSDSIKGITSYLEIKLISDQNNIAWYDFTFFPLPDEKMNRINSIYGTCRKVLHHKKGEYELQRINNNLKSLLEKTSILFGSAVKSRDDEIKARAAAESRLKETEDRFKQIIDRSPYATIVHQNGKILFANLNAVKLLGANSHQEITDKNLIHFIHPNYKDKLLERINKVAVNLEALPPVEEKYYRIDGKIINVEVVSVPFLLNGKFAYQDILSDKTKVISTNERLRILSSAVEQSSSGILITDLYGIIEYINPKISEITGYDKDELIGKSTKILKSGKQSSELYKELWHTILAGNNWTGELENKKKSGELYWDFSSISPIKDDDGVITHFLAVKDDITNRKKIESELMKSKIEAEEANKAKSFLIANISHELRTPLNGILGFAQLLKDDIILLDSDDIINKIIYSGKRLLNTLNLVLAATELDRNDYEPNYSDVDLPYLCTYIKTLYEEQAIEKNLKFNLDLQALDFSITSDEYLLTGILSNLVNNAIKYTQTGMVLLELKPPIQYEGEKFVLINVRDTGIGIKKEDYEIIFREFRQVSEGFQRDFEGLGLGLSVAKKMAKLLGIKILIESEYSKGSNFSVMIPLDKVTNSLKTKQVDAGLQNQKIPPQKSFHDRHLKILLVEDNLLNIEVIQLFLRKYWDVSFVRTGEDAIESAKNENYDLFLIDINLGQGIDGMEVLKRIREINSYKETPSIAITGYASEKHKKMFLENGFTRFLAKPFEKKELIDTINSIVRSN